MSTFARLTPKLTSDILHCRMPIVVNQEVSATDDMQPHGGERTTLEGFLGGHEVWADYLRLAGISVWLVWTFVTRPDAVLLWAPMLATFALSLAGVVLTRKALFPAWRRSVIVVLNVALLTYFVWAVGVQSTTLTAFYVVLAAAIGRGEHRGTG